jgi:hypothetical protein
MKQSLRVWAGFDCPVTYYCKNNNEIPASINREALD